MLRLIATAVMLCVVLALLAWDACLVVRSSLASRVITAAEFDNTVHYGRSAPGAARDHLLTILERELQSLEATAVLTPAQLAKLRAAGERDITHWLEAVDAARTRYTGRRLTTEQYEQTQEAIDKLRFAVQTSLNHPTSNYRQVLSVRDWQRVAEAHQALFAAQKAAADLAVFARQITEVTGPNGEQLYSVPEEFFADQVYGSVETVEAYRQLINEQLDAEISEIHRQCVLTESQRRKLRLAGQGDIKTWLERVDEVRIAATTELLQHDAFSVVVQKITLLRQEYRGDLFRGSSLFRKTLRHVLQREQLARMSRFERERRQRSIDAAISASALRPLQAQPAAGVRQKLVTLIADKYPTVACSGPYASTLVMLLAGELEADIRPLMSAEEWDTLLKSISRAKLAEPTLRNAGLWPLPSDDDASEE